VKIMNEFCSKTTRIEDGKYADCGAPLLANNMENQFLSGLSEKPAAVVELPPSVTLLDRFEVKTELGRGRFASVYLAEDMLKGVNVALKVVEVSPSDARSRPCTLQHEMIIHNNLADYTNVIRPYDLYTSPWGGTNLLLMSMEYADGGSLRRWLREHIDDVGARHTLGLDFLKQTCRGVGTVHDANITRLDLKPENLLISGGVMKISDFGTAGFAQRPHGRSNFYCESRPLEIGTPIYMSPEHFVTLYSDDLDQRADIYSIGIILFEILDQKGLPPFEGSFDRLRDLHLKVPAPRLSGTEEKFADIVARCLEKNKGDRYQTIWELLDDLEGDPGRNGRSTSWDKTELNADQAEESWKKVSASYAQGDLNEATRLMEDLLVEQSDHPQSCVLRKEIMERFDQAELFYREIAGNIENGDLTEQTELLEEAVRIYPDHPSGRLIQAKLTLRAKGYSKKMEAGYNALLNGNWEAALDYFKRAQRYHGGALHLGSTLELLNKIVNLRHNIDQALLNEDFSKARNLAAVVDHHVQQMKTNLPMYEGITS
jgi:serine/threonine protein kinase